MEEGCNWRDVVSFLSPALPLVGKLKDYDLLELFSRACILASKYELAEEIAKEGLIQYPNSLKLRISFAEIAMARKDWTSAIERWVHIVDNYKKFPHGVYVRLGRAFLNIGKIDEAERLVNSLSIEEKKKISDLISLVETRKAKKYKVKVTPFSPSNELKVEAVICRKKSIGKLSEFSNFPLALHVDSIESDDVHLMVKSQLGDINAVIEKLPPTRKIKSVDLVGPITSLGSAVSRLSFEYNFDLRTPLDIGFEVDGMTHWSYSISLADVQEVLEGKDGWLFLANDSNSSTALHTGSVMLDKSRTQRWQVFLNNLKNLQDERKVTYLVANSKESVFPEYYPDEHEMSPYRVVDQVQNLFYEAGARYVNPANVLRSCQETYYKTDTHWSDYGAYLAFSLCMKDLGIYKDYSGHFSFEKRKVVGDLGSKLDPPRKSNKMSLLMSNKDAATLIFSNQKSGAGAIDIYQNNNAETKGTLVIFGGSSAKSGAFYRYFLVFFKRVVLINQPGTYIKEIVEHERADYVILQTNERYLLTPGLMLDRFNESSGFAALSKMSLESKKSMSLAVDAFEGCDFYKSLVYAAI